MRADAESSCIESCTDSWHHWLGSLCGQAAGRTSRSSCCATNSACCADRSTDPSSPTPTGACSGRSRPRSRDLAEPVRAGNSAVVVDLPRWGPMLSPRVPNLVPIPGPRMERETPGQRPRPNNGHPHPVRGPRTPDRGGRQHPPGHLCDRGLQPYPPRRATSPDTATPEPLNKVKGGD